jgi:Alginate lyase
VGVRRPGTMSGRDRSTADRWRSQIVAGLALVMIGTSAAANTCASRLWPPALPESADAFANRLPLDLRGRILLAARYDASQAPAPVARLASAGVLPADDPRLLASRRAFRDADRVVLLALAWRMTSHREWLASAMRTLLEWSAVNQPTGHPIDETRLDGMLWGYDLLRCDLPTADRAVIEAWFARLREAKRRWTFGATTTHNNHRTHQLKMQLALQAMLDPGNLSELRAAAERHAKVNLADPHGASIDFVERDALHYHVYNLEAWIEIGLVSACCADAIDRSFAFMLKRLRDHPGAVEFQGSRARIDHDRAQAGFGYAQRRPYDAKRAERAVIGYATLGAANGDAQVPAHPTVQSSGQLWRAARYHLWKVPR